MKIRYTVILGILATLFVSILSFQFAMAAFPGEGLTISPPINEPKIKPGQTVENIIRVTNPTSELVEVYPQVMDFRAGGEGGEPSFYISEGYSNKFSFAKWVTFSTSKIALTPEQVVEFKYTLTIPENAEPGGHYGAVFFVSEPPKDENQGSKVSIGSMVGSLVLLTVPGDTIEKGIVDNFGTDKGIYFTGNTVKIESRISNVGNVHFKPKGDIVIKSIFGKQVTKLTFNEQSGNVLPDSTRKFENGWKYPWYQVGVYRAELATIYGISEKPLTQTIKFWILPWWFVVMIVFTLVLIYLLFQYLIRKKRLRTRITKMTKSSPRLVNKYKNNTPDDTDHKIILR